jgi:hypothetical protein
MTAKESKKKHIVVFHYSQTGQLTSILSALTNPLEESGCRVTYKDIVPKIPFVFPWSEYNFYESFPESRLEIPAEIEQIDFSDVMDADLVVLGYQPWFLAPSIPFASFIREESVQNYLSGRTVMTVIGSRNMWISAHLSVEERLRKYGCNWVGNIALEDRHNNLVGVLTVFRWLIRGQKSASRYLPEAGISHSDILSVADIAPSMLYALNSGVWDDLQKEIVDRGLVQFHPGLYFVESNGNRLWGKWAQFIINKGGYKDPRRAFRLTLFKYYLLTVIFAVSPFGSLFFLLTYPLRRTGLQKIGQKILFLQREKIEK